MHKVVGDDCGISNEATVKCQRIKSVRKVIGDDCGISSEATMKGRQTVIRRYGRQ